MIQGPRLFCLLYNEVVIARLMSNLIRLELQLSTATNYKQRLLAYGRMIFEKVFSDDYVTLETRYIKNYTVVEPGTTDAVYSSDWFLVYVSFFCENFDFWHWELSKWGISEFWSSENSCFEDSSSLYIYGVNKSLAWQYISSPCGYEIR